MPFCWTVWQPYRLSYILGLYMSIFYLPKDHFLKFWWKNVQNWWIWKIVFFWNNKIPVFKIQKKINSFWLNPLQMYYKFLGIMDWIQFLWLVWFPCKKLGVCNNMRYPVDDRLLDPHILDIRIDVHHHLLSEHILLCSFLSNLDFQGRFQNYLILDITDSRS